MLLSSDLAVRQRWLLQEAHNLHLLDQVGANDEEYDREEPHSGVGSIQSFLGLFWRYLYILEFDIRWDVGAFQLKLIISELKPLMIKARLGSNS